MTVFVNVPVFVPVFVNVITPLVLTVTARYQNYPTALSVGTGILEHRIV